MGLQNNSTKWAYIILWTTLLPNTDIFDKIQTREDFMNFDVVDYYNNLDEGNQLDVNITDFGIKIKSVSLTFWSYLYVYLKNIGELYF